MEKKKLNDVLKEKQKKEKEKVIEESKELHDDSTLWILLTLATFMETGKNIEIEDLKERTTFLEGKLSIIEKFLTKN